VTVLQLGSKTVPPSGTVAFDYAPTQQAGLGLHRVECTFNGQSQAAEARFTAP